MNSPQPLKQENVVTGSAPTIGATIGATVGGVLSQKLGLDAGTTLSVVGVTTALCTAVFHWLGNKLGVNL